MSTTAVANPFQLVAATTHDGPNGPYLIGHVDPSCKNGGTTVDMPADSYDAWPCPKCVATVPSKREALVERKAPLPTGDGTGSGAGAPAGPSERQLAYFEKLLAEREHTLTDDQIAPARTNGKRCSTAIDKLLASPRKAPAAGEPTKLRPNRFAGTCTECGNAVAEEAGFIRQHNGKWLTAHLPGTCPPAAPKVEAPKPGARPTLPDGIVLETNRVYVNSKGQYVRVVKARQSAGYYGKIWNGADWAYEGRGALEDLVRPITAEEAAQFGHAEHHCCFCGIELTDEGEGRSVEVGYGPHCARKNGLPWGVKKDAE